MGHVIESLVRAGIALKYERSFFKEASSSGLLANVEREIEREI
jgi:hypothetical protein